MKTLYIECNMGAAGDMLMAALSELLPDPEGFIARMNALGLPGVRFERRRVEKCGVTGTHIHVTVDGEEEHSHDVTREICVDNREQEQRTPEKMSSGHFAESWGRQALGNREQGTGTAARPFP